jgi:hypothetical protein
VPDRAGEPVTDPLGVLQRIRRPRPTPSAAAATPVEERCDLCNEPLAADHGHLVDLESRSLRCACRGCHLLFTAGGAGGRRYRAVPDRYRAVAGFQLSATQWDALQIPVGVAFFFRNSTLDRVVPFYPGPAGATESELSLDTWEQVAAAEPALATLEPDVEALLVRLDRERGTPECFIVPIDACYELVGRLRRSWRGFDGGREARDELDAFFARVRQRADR